jgi:anti-anti-sigma factor
VTRGFHGSDAAGRWIAGWSRGHRRRQHFDQGDSVIRSKPTTSSTEPGRQPDGTPADPTRETIPSQATSWEARHGTPVGQTLHVSVQRPEPGSVVVHMRGEIDMAAVPRLAELIRQRLTAAFLRTVVLDLSEVDFLSTGGLELLLHAQRRAEHRGVALYVVPDDRCVRRLVDLTGTGDRFCWRSSVAEAVASAR